MALRRGFASLERVAERAAGRTGAAAVAFDAARHPRAGGGRFGATGAASRSSSKPVPTAPRAGRTSGVTGDHVIHIHATSNPKRVGSASHARFAAYRHGMSVKDYIDAMPALGHTRATALADINWDVRHGHISIHEPTVISKTAPKSAAADIPPNTDRVSVSSTVNGYYEVSIGGRASTTFLTRDRAVQEARAVIHRDIQNAAETGLPLRYHLDPNIDEPAPAPAAIEPQTPGTKFKAKDFSDPAKIPKPGTPQRAFHDKMLEAAGNFGPDSSLAMRYSDRTGKLQGFTVGTGDPNDQIRRNIIEDGDVVEHAFFRIMNQSKRGTGAAKAFLADSMDAYVMAGYKKVEVHANIDVGGYAWAKYGFVPDKSSWDSLKTTVANRTISANIDPATVNALKDLTRADSDPKNLWKISDMSQETSTLSDRYDPSSARVKSTVGKSLLLGSDWSGTIDLSDAESMDRFYKYARGSKK